MAKGSLYYQFLLRNKMKENTCVTARPTDSVTSRPIVNIRRDLTKMSLVCTLVIKLMQEKVKVWLVAFNTKKYFSNLAGNSEFTFYCQIRFCGYTSTITYFHFNFKMEW